MSQTKIDISNLSDAVIAALSVPKITSITYPGDDTAANPTGGQEIILTGSGFGTGAIVNVAGVPVSVSSVVNNNTISFTSPAKATGTYSLSVINTDGGIATSISNIEYSGVPAWSTPAGTLGTLYETSFINAQLTAASDSTVTYAVTAGVLPAGTTLNSTTGILIGTAASVASSTTYSFTVDAVDAEQQNTSRNFSATINPDVVSWSSPANGVTYTSTEGNVFTQALSAVSAAGKTISYSANALPSGLSITGSTLAGTFSAATTSASLITATAAATGKTATRTLNWSIASLIPAWAPVSGQLFTWGRNDLGQLGLGTSGAGTGLVPTQVGSQSTWVSYVGGNAQSLGLKNDGTMWTWGYQYFGTPVQISSPIQVGAVSDWRAISSGNTFYMALNANGTLWTWGATNNGTNGRSNTSQSSLPMQVGALTNWKQISAGQENAYAVKTDGTLWAWGKNTNGELGLGDTTNRSSPVQIGIMTNWSSVAASSVASSVAAIKTDGTLWTWGANQYYGQLGIGDTLDRSSPVQVGLLTNWKSVASGGYHMAGIKTDYTLWTWGFGTYGALGLGNINYRSSPVQVGTGYSKVAANFARTTAAKTNGTLWGWGFGDNGGGGMGDGTSVHRSSPVQLGALTTWLDVLVTANSNGAIKS